MTDEMLHEVERYRGALKASGDSYFHANHVTGAVEFGPEERYLEADYATIDEYVRAVHPEDQERFVAAMHEHLAGASEIFDVAYRVPWKTGEWRWLRTRGLVVARDASGRPLRSSGVSFDVTEQKRTEEALRVSLAENERLVRELRHALGQVKELTGLLPICASCHKIRREDGRWQILELYVKEHTAAEFTHSYCPDCYDRIRADLGPV